MGVTFVLDYKAPAGLSGQQAVEQLQLRLEQLGAEKTGPFTVDCETYQSVQSDPPKSVHLLHNSETPATSYSVHENGMCLVADGLLDNLMFKLKDYYSTRKNQKIESKGQRYELRDFVVKIGGVMLGKNNNLKGILVEVEFTPCVVVGDCAELMKEFITSILDKNYTTTNVIKSKLTDRAHIFKPEDTMLQYLECFSVLRKNVSVGLGGAAMSSGSMSSTVNAPMISPLQR